MEKRYISESRYKKGVSRKRRDSSTVKSNLKTNVVKKSTVTKVKPKKKIIKKRIKKEPNSKLNIITCVILLILIGIISRALLKGENEPFIPISFGSSENEENIKVGIVTTDNLLDENINNVIIAELNKYSKDMLLVVNSDYTIEYKCISKIEKVSNKEYILYKNEDSEITLDGIKKKIESYRSNKESVYYSKVENIKSVTVIDEQRLKIELKKADIYFVYNLDLPMDTTYNTNYIKSSNSTSSKLVYNRHEDANEELPKSITVSKYKDMYAACNAYKSQKIDIFVTNAENVQNILGKYEYNIKTYRNGESVFLIGNYESKLYSRPEVRQAIAYGIDRDSIIKDVLKQKGDKIDLPYIYDEVKYKYDVYAAENLLLTNEYKKSNKVYSKIENGVKINLNLDLLVNKNDEIKVSIAKKIKNNLTSIGISVNIEKLSESKLKKRIKNNDYDLVLATVNLNINPDISFIQNDLFMTEKITTAKANVEKTDIANLQNNIKLLQNAMSDDISVVGIYSDVSYLIYSKDIIGIDNTNYMNIFESLFR